MQSTTPEVKVEALRSGSGSGTHYFGPTGVRDLLAMRALKSFESTTAPTADTGPNPKNVQFAVGDIVWNTNPSAGGKIGWVCTTGDAAAAPPRLLKHSAAKFLPNVRPTRRRWRRC